MVGKAFFIFQEHYGMILQDLIQASYPNASCGLPFSRQIIQDVAMKVRALHKKRVLLRHISLDSIIMKRKKGGTSYKMKGFGRMHFASIVKKCYSSDMFVYGPRMAPEIERGL